MKNKIFIMIFSFILMFTFINKIFANNTGSYYVEFNENGGYGLECESPLSYVSDGVCGASLTSGTKVSYPSKSDSMTSGDSLLVGWSKNINCLHNGMIRNYNNNSFNVSSSATYYACYVENISDIRYALSNSAIDSNGDIPCGAELNITYCYKNNINGDHCYATYNGIERVVNRNKLSDSKPTCSDTTTSTTVTYSDVEEKNADRWVNTDGTDFKCGDKLFITDCTKNECNYSKVNDVSTGELKVVSRSYLDDEEASAKQSCNKLDEFDSLKNCNSYNKDKLTNQVGSVNYSNFCYEKTDDEEDINDELSSLISCKSGYKYSGSSISDESVKCNSNGICINNYTVLCKLENQSLRPSISVSSAIVNANNTGTITVKVNNNRTDVKKYYYSSDYKTPTSSSKWISFSGTQFTINETPGIYYIWVKDNDGNISSVVSGAVLDTTNMDTTIHSLELKNDSGEVIVPTRNEYVSDSLKYSKFKLLSNENGNDKVEASGFNPFDMEYKITVDSPTLSVYATLTSTDSSYVDGYGPRTVNLEYGINTILIKIKNNEGKTRTYTILATRNDNRSSDNTLSDLKVSEGTLDFNSNVTEYNVVVGDSVNSVNVTSTIGSDLASYVSGYEPGNVDLVDGYAIKTIKVQSQTGSVRSYTLTFTQSNDNIIEDESLQLYDLEVSNANIAFESKIADYNTSVNYEYDMVSIKTVLKDKDSYVELYRYNNSINDYVLIGNKNVKLDVGTNLFRIKVINNSGNEAYYRLVIIRKEMGLDVSNDTSLKDLSVLGYNIKFNKDKKEYTVKIKTEKSLVITATPLSNRSEVFIRGNNELTGFSTVRVKVVAENGEFDTYSIDIKKDPFNKTIEIAAIIVGAGIIIVSSCILIIKKKVKSNKEYIEE